MIPLVMVGVWGWKNIGHDTYSIKDLLIKYPLISDLKTAVDSGELDYNKLPSSAKDALIYYEQSKDNNELKIIEGIK